MMKDKYIIDGEFDEQQYHSLKMVLEFFDNDEEKAKKWFEIPNPLLGDIKPWVLLLTRPEKLERIVTNMLEGNHP